MHHNRMTTQTTKVDQKTCFTAKIKPSRRMNMDGTHTHARTHARMHAHTHLHTHTHTCTVPSGVIKKPNFPKEMQAAINCHGNHSARRFVGAAIAAPARHAVSTAVCGQHELESAVPRPVRLLLLPPLHLHLHLQSHHLHSDPPG